MQSVRYKILSLWISSPTFHTILKEVVELARHRKKAYLCFANVHMTIEAYKDKSFREAVNNATFTLADGVPVQKALKLLHGVKQERIAGMDFMPAILKEAEVHHIPVYFYGSTPDVLALIHQKINRDYKKLTVAGMYSPPFRSLSTEELQADIDRINQSRAGIVLVALGCPKQEFWMAGNLSEINAVLLGVGGAFPVFAGLQKRAPLWMRKSGLEWVYRLKQEPGRLFKRYFYTNSLFLILLSSQFLKQLLKREKKGVT